MVTFILICLAINIIGCIMDKNWYAVMGWIAALLYFILYYKLV